MGDTLQDLKDRDIDNLQYLLEKKETHLFKDAQAAFTASGEMVRLAVLRCGVDLHKLMEATDDLDAVGEMVAEAMEQNGVRIEDRPYRNAIDHWRSGVYIYKDNEIASWIGGITKGENGIGFTITTTESKPLV